MGAFLKLEGVNGDAMAAGYVRWIALDSVQFGRLPALTAVGAASARVPGGQTELHVTARVGSHSPLIMSAAATGKSFDGELAMTDTGGRYATVRLVRAFVASYATSTGSERGLGPMESLSLMMATPFKWVAIR